MKKFGSVLLGALFLNLMAMTTALADSVVTPPEEPPGGIVVVTPPGAQGGPNGLAFAGVEVTVWMALSVALLVAGVALVVAGRRRRVAAE